VKYLFIDTNNFVSCALLYKEEHTPSAIDKLKNILYSNKSKLLLPEIVEIEFFRVVDDSLVTIKEQVSKFKKTLESDFPSYLEYEKKEFMSATEDILGKRIFSSKAAKAKIQALFSGDYILKIPLTPEIFLNAIKRGLSGKKPYKYKVCKECNEIKNLINNDSLIFESILSKLKELGKDNELVFCSGNTEDFADKDKKGLHPELSKDLPKGVSAKYYLHFVEALKKEFAEKIPEKEVKNIAAFAELLKTSQDRFASTAAQIARLQQESGISKMMQSIPDSSTLQMFRALQESPTIRAIQDSRMLEAIKAVLESPTIRAIQDSRILEAVKAAQESPIIRAMNEASRLNVEKIKKENEPNKEVLEPLKSTEDKNKDK